MAQVSIVMGSKSDFSVAKEAYDIVREFGITAEMQVLSAHRTPDEVIAFSEGAKKNGIKVIIAAAGKAAHLGGFIAAKTTAVVIGLPIKSSTLDGIDSLLSIVQMPKGVPVATVAINGGFNAGLLAVEILAASDEKLDQKLVEYKEKMRREVLSSNKTLEVE